MIDPRRIRSRYLAGYFIIDLASTCFPLGFIFLFAGEGSGGETEQLRNLRFLKLLRLMRVSKLSRMLDALTAHLPVELTAITTLVIVMLRFLLVAHWLGLGWCASTTNEPPPLPGT